MSGINNGVVVSGQNPTGDATEDARDLAFLAKSKTKSVTIHPMDGSAQREFLIPLEDPKGLLNVEGGRHSNPDGAMVVQVDGSGPVLSRREILIGLRGPKRESSEVAMEDIRPEGGWQTAASKAALLVEQMHKIEGSSSLDSFLRGSLESLRDNRIGSDLRLQSRVNVERVKTLLASLPKKGVAIPRKDRKLGPVWAGIAGPVLAGLISEPESPATVLLSRAGRHLKGFFKAYEEKRKTPLSLNKREERILKLIFRIVHLGMHEAYREFPEEMIKIFSHMLRYDLVAKAKVSFDEERCVLVLEEISVGLPAKTDEGKLRFVKAYLTGLKMASEGLQAALGFEAE